MKQVIQNYKTGELKVVEVPTPTVKPGGILVRNVNSLVSIGTEKLMIDLARKSLLGKALTRPDLVTQVINKVRTEGLLEAHRQAMHRLDSPVPLGYSCAGEVIEAGERVDEFRVGDRVACFGSGYASHAEVVFVPKNLCVRIPENVDYEHAAFVALGAIALHGVRMAKPSLGENIVVIGLGLLGQIAVQLLKASGCSVFGIDIDPAKTALSLELGADDVAIRGKNDVMTRVKNFSRGYGADAVIIFASTSSNEPIELAAEIARDRARIVAPGMIKLDLPRKIFYEKELRFVISRSSGPGVYDLVYEEKGIDYPISYVRWTERRNMEEFLTLLSQGKVKLDKIITHRFSIKEAGKAYEMITGKTSEKYIGVLLYYDYEKPLTIKVQLKKERVAKKPGEEEINVGLIGAGLFANTTLLPALKKIAPINLRGVATATGSSGQHTGNKFGFEYCTSDYKEILADERIDCVMIATRHNLHAKIAVEALKREKDVFVEKPLALSVQELDEIIEARKEHQGRLMVGFNRRFSPFSIKAKKLLGQSSEPIVISCRVNAGFVPKDSWVQDPTEGRGRIIGEVCHFIDLIQYLTDSLPVRVYAETISGGNKEYTNEDNVIINIKLRDGSISSITYVAKGDKSFPRERVEIFGNNSVCVINNFKSLVFTKSGKREKMRRFNVDRGHQNELSTFFSAIKEGKEIPVDFEEYIYTTVATFKILESIQKGAPADIHLVDLEVVER